jgi:hypothetical protein
LAGDTEEGCPTPPAAVENLAPQDSHALTSALGAIFIETAEKSWAGPVEQAHLQPGADGPVDQTLDGLPTMVNGPPAAAQCLLHESEVPQGSLEAQIVFQVSSSLLWLP